MNHRLLKQIEKFIILREKVMKRRNQSMASNVLQGWNLTQLHLVSEINNTPDKATNSYLSERLYISKPAVTKAIKKLISAEVVISLPKKQDQRTHLYSLTAYGRELAALHDRLHQESVKRYEKLFSKFADEELKVVSRFMEEWMKDMEENKNDVEGRSD